MSSFGPRSSSRVPGEGKRPAALMIIGEMPGPDEGRAGRPFVGKSGRELRRYLNGYELPTADDCYLTNFSKTVAPTVKEMVVSDQDREWLLNEIRAVKPTVIATLGAHITGWLIGADHHLETVHGIPHPLLPERRAAIGFDVLVLPGYNPAAMLHSPKLQSVFAYDMRRLSLLLRNRLPRPIVDTLGRDYADAAISHDLFRYHDAPVLGMDTEGWADRPWCVGVSGEPGTGRIIKAGDTVRLGYLQSFMDAPTCTALVLHSALHDLPVLRALGLDLPAEKLHDTMIMAYLLGLEPQGLKALSYRHAGMAMQEYADITADAAGLKAFTWLMQLHDRLPPKPERLTKRDALAAEAAGAPYYTDTRVKPDGKTETRYWDLPPLDGDDQDRAHARSLIARMLEKHGAAPDLRKTWLDCRAREILVDELCDLHPLDQDPEEPTLDEIDPAVAIDYSARDPDGTLRVYHALRPQIAAMGLDDVYAVDLSIIPMIDRMQTVGLGVDLPHFQEYADFLRMEEAVNLDAIEQTCGYRLNPNSGDQVAELLYDTLKIHEQAINLKLKKTKGGRFSTNDKTLEALAKMHPIIPLIQEGREIRKLRSTYCEAIPRLVGSDGRLHPNYRITRTETGRLSASDPNVLALPKHSERGKLIRYGFIAGDGHELGEWDLAQIEMCMFAHDSQDPVLMAAIIAGLDLHYDTAARVILGLTIPARVDKAWYSAHVTKKQRFAAKAVNFGILMGITAFGLLDQLHKNGQLQWTLDMCEELLQNWHRIYKVASAYIKQKHAEARRYGFVRDYWGRLRWLEGIHSHDDYIRAEAERMAQATPTQSGAQGVMKRIMRAAWPLLQQMRQEFWVEPLLQIHDALVLEYDVTKAVQVDQIMSYVMQQTVELRVPVRSAWASGKRLSDLGE